MKKLKIDLIKVKEILTREQLKHVVGGTGSWGDSCANDMDCWLAHDNQGFCDSITLQLHFNVVRME